MARARDGGGGPNRRYGSCAAPAIRGSVPPRSACTSLLPWLARSRIAAYHRARRGGGRGNLRGSGCRRCRSRFCAACRWNRSRGFPGAGGGCSRGRPRWCGLRWRWSGVRFRQRPARGERRRGRTPWVKRGSANQLLESGVAADDGLIALGAGGNAADFDAGALFQEGQVVLGARGERVVIRNAEGGRVPAGHLFEDGFDLFDFGDGWWHVADLAAGDFVADAHRDGFELVEHVELGHHDGIEAVDGGGVAEQRHVEPAAAARPAGDGAEFVAAGANPVAGG